LTIWPYVRTLFPVYVKDIEPRLTPYRPVAPSTAAEALTEWLRDLEEELAARLEQIGSPTLAWQPHPDMNSPAVTAWHIARWLDVLATRAFAPAGPDDELWHTLGWRQRTGYDPSGVGFLGLGTLTGYTPSEMRAVPEMSAEDLQTYASQAADQLATRIAELGEVLFRTIDGLDLSPYQMISGTLQGSFGHLGEIDALAMLHALRAETT
jgi:hypothetical protein